MARQSLKISPLIYLLFPVFLSQLACTAQMPAKPALSSRTQARLSQEYEKLREEREQAQLIKEYSEYSIRAAEALKKRDEDEKARRESITKGLESQDFNFALAPYLSNIDALKIPSAKSKDDLEIEDKLSGYKDKLNSLKEYSPITISDVDLKSIEFELLKTDTDYFTLEVTREGEAMLTYKTNGGIPQPVQDATEATLSLPKKIIFWFGNLIPKTTKPVLATSLP